MLMQSQLESTYEWGLVDRRTNHVLRGLELSVLPSPPQFQGGERSQRLNLQLMLNDLIIHAYLIKPPLKPKRMGVESFCIGEYTETR